jgi:hypothetical protein
VETAEPTDYDKTHDNYGSTLKFVSTDGIAIGSYVFTTGSYVFGAPKFDNDHATIPAGMQVKEVTQTTVVLNGTLPNYVPAGTVVSFLGPSPSSDPASAPTDSFALDTNGAATKIGNDLLVLHFADTSGITVGMTVSGPSTIASDTTVAQVPTSKTVVLSQPLSGAMGSGTSVTFTLDAPFAYFSLTPKSGTPAAHPTTLKFNANQTNGVAVGMTLKPISGLIGPGTKVTHVTSTTVALSKKLLGPLPSGGQSITFTFPLSKGIAQHIEPSFSFDFFTGLSVALVPSSVATAVIQLNPASPDDKYVDLKISAMRGSEIIPVGTTFYNVKVSTAAIPTTPEQLQAISPNDTSLYLSLPPPPGPHLVSLTIPENGSAPPFDQLYSAITTALANDPITTPPPTVFSLISSPSDCTRIAYDIVWSYQNTPPLPPDPLESLYTNPPNPGGGGGNASGSGDSNNFEQDRQKFEGTLNSFYSTRNASAERLAKFVAAASAAVACEEASLNSTSALLEFAVDPSSSFTSFVESEVLVNGLGTGGPSGINFGVPAAFFYALGATLDKSTTAAHRFQMATSETIERLLQQFAAAEDAKVIVNSEAFTYSSLSGQTISYFQAARRLVALGVSAASASPTAAAFSGSPLASLINDWLGTVEPVPQNPPLSYQNTDFNIWTQQLAASDPQGYLDLDLAALTQGYVIPPFAAVPTASAGSTLTFEIGTGIGPGMSVGGPNIASGTVVQSVTNTTATTTVTLSPAPSGTVPASAVLVFNFAIPPTTATTTADCPSGNALTFGGTSGITPGMAVFGTNIPPGTTVQAADATTVTLSNSVSGDVPSGSAIAFVTVPSSPVATATTTADCPSGTTTLTFGGVAGTSGISAGMSVYGTSIPSGTTVQSLTATTVTISGSGVSADVPSGSVVTFTAVSSTLADQIAAWLPSTTTPQTANPTVATLKQVTAAQWTSFFTTTGSAAWLPPFTQPTTAGASPGPVTPKAGYIATRIRAFIRAVHQFFTVSSIATSAQLPPPGTPPAFALPAYDPITQAVGDLPGTFDFGNTLSSTDLTTAVQQVFSGDHEAQAWLVQAMTTVNELWEIASVVPNPTITGGYTLPDPVSFSFSVMEALYARGFRRAKDIADLSAADFQQALTGTVAYDFADSSSHSLYKKALSVAQREPPTGHGDRDGGFQPVNPDGSLVNCVPPPCLSPTGPIAYLQEMLTLSERSTCASITVPPVSLTTAESAEADATVLLFESTTGVSVGMPASGTGIPPGTTVTAVTAQSVTLSHQVTGVPFKTVIQFTAPTLGDVLSQRRGTLGDLAASCANLETPLPLIDIVNECLEYLGTAASPPSGTVYDTAGDELAGHALCHGEPCPDEEGPEECHDPARLFAALPQYSTPAAPVAANAAVEPTVFNKLKADFSTCLLPYSQALDVSRAYLNQLGSSRFEELRAFRKCVTEFVLDPTQPPAGFQSWQLRYPVRIDIAIEYLGITPEEYSTLFHGAAAPTCAEQTDDAAGTAPDRPTPAALATPASLAGSITVPAFLAETCLTYCEFYELWQSGFVAFRNGADESGGAFPQCEPCCLDDLWLQFPEGQQQLGVVQLLVFVRLWRKLRDSRCSGYSFARLRDICDVLKLYAGGTLNPDFVRQLAAFQMLRDHFGMDLADPAAEIPPTAIDEDRTQLLALWAGPTAAKWQWAVQQLITCVTRHAQQRHRCQRRAPEFIKLLTANLDPLSRLAGFDPDSATDSWHAAPTHTLRFAEVLAKIYASDFSVGELMFLFTADPHLDGDDPFPLQEENEALDDPLDLPDDQRAHALWRMRHEMLAADVTEEEAEEWPWRRIESALHADFGFPPDDIQALGKHFFHRVLARSGQQVSAAKERFVSDLDIHQTSPAMWNTPPDGPFQYDATALQLTTSVPLTDRAVISKLTQIHDLNDAEQQAVQDLFYQPRALLARFALLFADFATAQRQLIEEEDEAERFAFFRHQFLLCRHRCRVIARHLSEHVVAATGQDAPEDDSAAWLILRALAADENKATSNWGNDSGAMPALTWAPPPNGSALAALLGLAGTGLVAEYRSAEDTVVWRDQSGPSSGFGAERDRENCPVPTVLPGLDATLTPQELQFASVHNGFLMNDATGAWLGGAQGFAATWSGALLVEQEGTYEFWAGVPAPGEDRPDLEAAEHQRWRVVLRRGQRSWVILSHHWPGEEEHRSSALPLRRGAYEVTAEMVQRSPEFGDEEQVLRQRTGFRVEYSGRDTDGRRTEIPHSRLFVIEKDQTLADGIDGLSPGATGYLGGLYVSSLRDIRRTYQRAFMALLFVHRFALSARRQPHGTSELGYLLSQPTRFAGAGYYQSGGSYTRHAADFDFDFLPLRDDYHPPAQDARTSPAPQRSQAMFDWWERMFDYTMARAEVRQRCGRELWHLFEEAQQKQPTDPTSLLRHMGADARHWAIDLRYCQGQNVPVYQVTSADLEDDRWTLRAWHADSWLRGLERCFDAKDITLARPDLWASEDPSAPLPGETDTGNANLLAFVVDGCLENGAPRRYEDLRCLDDGLRDRGRNALIAYLCHGDRVELPWQPGQFATVARDLSDLLLLDVEAGLCEKASRIEEAVTAVQSFVRRSQLGLEPDWKVTHEFSRLWDSQFDTYRKWERCKRRELYHENWIEWDELDKARRIEAFRFLESQLRASTLTLAAPGGLDWWADDTKALERALELLQRRIPSELQRLSAPPESVTREGLTTLGSPEYATQPTWLAAAPQPSITATSGSTDNPQGPTAPNAPGGTAGPAAPDAPGTPADPGAPNGAGTPAGDATPTVAAPPTGATPAAADAGTVHALVEAVVAGSTQPQPLPLWMESAIKLGTTFVRVAAAGIPQAALRFAPHTEEPGSACCHECGHDHPIVMDEYYFWLTDAKMYSYTDQTDSQSGDDASFTGSYQFGFQDSFYDPFQQQSAEWDDEGQVPSLLAKWKPDPAVRLAWCRVHNGQFGQPRKSTDCVPIQTPADLVFLGRAADSLYFQVSGSATPLPPGYGADTSPPGFRYDLPSDDAVALPQVLAPPTPTGPSPYPGGLLSYPFFAYHDPGARLFPRSWFPASLVIADTLRAHCRFELALRWYRRPFNPLQRDCAWVHCPDQSQAPSGDGTPVIMSGDGASGRGGCCDSSKVTEEGARNRALVLHYCRTLIDWGDALMRRRRSPEAFQQARVIYDMAAKIVGARPETIMLEEAASAPTVAEFVPAYPPLNPQLMDLYDLVADRLELIHMCLNGRRLRNGQLGKGMPYFGDSVPPDQWRTVAETCADEEDWCLKPSPYRFLFQIQKAIEIAGQVRGLGAALLSAYEKCDAEYLTSIRAQQEREMLALGVSIRQDQWRDADWQVQALQQTKDVNQTNLLYYASLFQNGLLNNEIQNLTLTSNALQTRTGANVIEAAGEIMNVIPDMFVGAMSSGASPPIGTKLAHLFEAIGRIMQTIADIQSTTAGMDMTQAGWQRRSDEWLHQMQVLPIEIQQIELQILGAHRRRDQALRELNNQQRQIEHATEVLDFLRDRFTATELYLWLRKETSILHARMYELARHAALEAQRAFNFERGYTRRHFLPEETWDDLHAGLLAGERLEVALRHMEKAYLDENRRELELTKHISLRLDFPAEYLQLRTTGYCEISIPEWMFDRDYPGHYLRRIKDATLTLACVTGPYTGVHCRLTLLSSMTRVHPEVRPPAHHCCYNGKRGSAYEACADDPRIVREYAARESIATSSGQNDSGMFELNFRDERYLPFEYQGAVSRWRFELPPENNSFDLDTVSDVVLHLNYTAREGGEPLRAAAWDDARRRLPGDGLRLFDVRHDFPDAWPALRVPDRDDGWSDAGQHGHGERHGHQDRSDDQWHGHEGRPGGERQSHNGRPDDDRHSDGDRPRRLRLDFMPTMFPFVPGRAVRVIDRLVLMFAAPGAVSGRHHLVRFWPDGDDCDHAMEVDCVVGEAWPGFFYGTIDLRHDPLGPLREDRPVTCTFEIPAQAGPVRSAFLVASYDAAPARREG